MSEVNVLTTTQSQRACEFGTSDSFWRKIARDRLGSLFAVFAACLIIVIEFKLFRAHIRTFIAPFFPIADDQVFTYVASYDLYFSLLTTGPSCLFSDPELLRHCTPMKGALVPLLGTLCCFFNGPSRLAVSSVNFIFFCIGQLALLCFCRRWFGWSTALLALGLFVSSFTVYFNLGGITDMRYDFAGMIIGGASLMCIVQYLKEGKNTDALLVLCSLVFCAVTRSILLFYWLGTLSLLVAGFFLAQRTRSSDWANVCLRRTRLLLLLVVAVMLLHFGLFWKEFCAYYLLGTVSTEAITRLHEYGLNNKLELVAYYAKSFWFHFANSTSIAMLVSCVGLAVSMFLNPTNSKRTSAQDRLIVLIFVAFSLSVFAFVSCYHPSPLALGILCIPHCIFLARFVCLCIGNKTVTAFAAVVVMVTGLLEFGNQMRSPSSLAHPVPLESMGVEVLQERVLEAIEAKGNAPCFSYYMFPHGGLNPLTARIKWYETRKTSFPSNATGSWIPAFPAVAEGTILELINRADIVVAPTVLPARTGGGFEHEGLSATRAALLRAKAILSKEFVLVEELPTGGPGWKLGVFIRAPKYNSNLHHL